MGLVQGCHLTRTTLHSLVGKEGAEPVAPPVVLPDHPAYQQIMDAFGDLARLLRARDLCQALDLPIVSKNVENIRSTLKRLVSRGILVVTGPGLFSQHREGLKVLITQAFEDSQGTYGYRRVHAQLERWGGPGRSWYSHLMRVLGLVPCRPGPRRRG
ncbi:hypothetical protein F4561_003620 [Lipingzhangella halophila]|uniref:HTH-like domain-containing protein n=1 Tax=Lipingzhangella halophila TaxID=1783352 RepID=A0A7W7RIV2_9ACTN|nr:IS3 family transposase [Lipingzhangella halophila]MBB4932800.1 hypothetical protein [Lipingzhangella halophila]